MFIISGDNSIKTNHLYSFCSGNKKEEYLHLHFMYRKVILFTFDIFSITIIKPSLFCPHSEQH